ncbi:hypothetical protein CHS0354_003083, partial [Potamilus streckersoni]
QGIDGFVFSNAMDGDMTFKCSSHQYISYVGGHHDNNYEDRQYEFRCTDVPVANEIQIIWRITTISSVLDPPRDHMCQGLIKIDAIN